MPRFIHDVSAPLYIRRDNGRYREATPTEVATTAASYMLSELKGQPVLGNPESVRSFLRQRLGHLDYEVFGVIFLDTRHRLIDYLELFRGTLDSCSIHPREVVKEALYHNAAAAVFAHCHPSGDPTPSRSDIKITNRLRTALDLIDVRVLDHFVVGSEIVSMAERGLI